MINYYDFKTKTISRIKSRTYNTIGIEVRNTC